MLNHLTSKGTNRIVPWLSESQCPTGQGETLSYTEESQLSVSPGTSTPVCSPQVGFNPSRVDQEHIKMVVDSMIELMGVLRGQRACYIGSNTRVKKQKSPSLVSPDLLEQPAMTLGQLLCWVGTSPCLGALISTMIMEKTHIPPGVVAAAADTIAGGEFEHRGKVSVLAQGAHINFDPTVMSYIRMTTNTALEFAEKDG